ncbi:unnamed protein product [Rotaria sp. Silwood1]|nr:unnamed protein product [Rotaria sp. Silwood1]CAF1633058.1 unnamed protein product [Rotaria sp. Silwood1]
MSSNGNSDMNKILVTKDKDEDDGKYLILLVYLLEENGCCGGGYHEKSLSIHGGVSGQSFNEMLEQAYESLEVAMKEEDRIPFDINDIKKSVNLIHYDRAEYEIALDCVQEDLNIQLVILPCYHSELALSRQLLRRLQQHQ